MTGRENDAHRPRVVYWNNQPTPYLTARLNAVVDRGDIDLEVWFDELRQADRSWEVRPQDWRFRWRLVRTVGPAARSVSVPVRELREVRPDVLVCNYDQPNMVLGALIARLFAHRVALRVLPSFPAQSPPTWLKTTAWQILFRVVDGAKVPGPDGAAFAGRHGLPGSRAWRVTQSIDVDLYGSGGRSDPVAGTPIRFVVVSRMIRSKGIDELLAAWRVAQRAGMVAELVLVGDGSDEQRLRGLSSDLPDVRWLGFHQPREVPALLAAADVLIFPTLGDPNGLVVEEAMAAGLPVLSTDAAGDIRTRLPEGEAGWVVPAGDVDALAARIAEVAALPRERLAVMGAANAQRVSAFAPTFYARDFSDFVAGVRARRRRVGAGGTLLILLCVSLRRILACAFRAARVRRGNRRA